MVGSVIRGCGAPGASRDAPGTGRGLLRQERLPEVLEGLVRHGHEVVHLRRRRVIVEPGENPPPYALALQGLRELLVDPLALRHVARRATLREELVELRHRESGDLVE